MARPDIHNRWVTHRYEVNLRTDLGRGSFGTVYKATDAQGKMVAAKKITEVGSYHEEFIKFCNAHHVGCTGHENIIKLLDIDNNPDLGEIWLFTEYCSYGNLSELYKKYYEKINLIDSRLQLMKQIAEGISYLHGKGIVHRDLKPENILVTHGSTPDNVTVKISDFGMTRYLDPESASSATTNKFTYMPPESWMESNQGTLKYRRNIDIFSMGLTFLAMVQVQEGEQLLPKVEGEIDHQTEMAKSIGYTMFMRQKTKGPNLNVVVIEDEEKCTTNASVKMIIRKMVHFRPNNRPSARQVLVKLQEVGFYRTNI